MRTWWQSLDATLTKDDLFLRVVLFVFGLFALWLGVEAVRWLINPDEQYADWFSLVGLLALLFLLWGSVILVSAFTPPASRWSRFAEKCYPDTASLDDAVILLAVVLLPAVVVTMLLRLVGVRGYIT